MTNLHFNLLITKYGDVITNDKLGGFSLLQNEASPGDVIYTIRQLEDKTLQVTNQYTKPEKQIRVLNAKPILSNQETATNNPGLSVDQDNNIPF